MNYIGLEEYESDPIEYEKKCFEKRHDVAVQLRNLIQKYGEDVCFEGFRNNEIKPFKNKLNDDNLVDIALRNEEPSFCSKAMAVAASAYFAMPTEELFEPSGKMVWGLISELAYNNKEIEGKKKNGKKSK